MTCISKNLAQTLMGFMIASSVCVTPKTLGYLILWALFSISLAATVLPPLYQQELLSSS